MCIREGGSGGGGGRGRKKVGVGLKVGVEAGHVAGVEGWRVEGFKGQIEECIASLFGWHRWVKGEGQVSASGASAPMLWVISPTGVDLFPYPFLHV